VPEVRAGASARGRSSDAGPDHVRHFQRVTRVGVRLLEGGVDLLPWRRMFDLLSAKAAIAAVTRMVRHGRVVPFRPRSPSRLPRMLPAPISRAITSPARSASTSSGSPARRAGGDVRATATAERDAPDAALVPSQRRVAERGRRQDALRPLPGRIGRTPGKFVTDTASRSSAVLRTTPEHMARVIEAVRPLSAAPLKPYSTRRSRRSTRRRTTSRTARCCWWANARTPTAQEIPRRHARGDGTPAWDGRDQIKEGAHILDVCVRLHRRDGVK